MADRSIDYIVKDFDSFVDGLITFATVNYGPDTNSNRQWTSFNVDDFSRTWLELVAYVADVIFFYLDVQATQSNLQTATIRSSVLDIAKQFGYVVPTAASASGIAQFTVTGPVTIPIGFKVAAENGSEFFVSSSSPQPGSTTFQILISVIQGTQQNETFTAIGVQNEEVTLGFTSFVVDTTNSITSLRSPKVVINGNPYTLVNSFIDSLPGDLHYRLINNSDGQATLRFGDGVFGKKLVPNDAIVVDYRTGGGTIGNISSGTLTALTDSLPNIAAVTNLLAFSGGSDESSIDQLRELVPASLRTLERAVSVDDYGDILEANFNSVLLAAAEANTTDIGTDINIYVVPSGNTITSITTNTALFNSLSTFIDQRKTVTTTFKILDANSIETDFDITVFLNDGASQDEAVTNINTSLSTFFSLQNGDTDGSGTKFGQEVLINDMYTILDTIDGISRFEINKMNYIPRVEITAATGTNYLVSKVEVLQASEVAEWLVAPEESTTSPENVPYTVFKKIKGKVSNLSEDSLSDNKLNLSVVESTTSAINTNGAVNTVFDSSRTFLTNEFVGGEFLFVDSSSNIWNISANDAHSLTLSTVAINNTLVNDVTDGEYKIVKSVIGGNILFRDLIFAGIDYNTHDTIFRIGSSFNLVGTINDKFQISLPQTNVGNFGIPTTIDSFLSNTPNPGLGQIHFAGNPDLSLVTGGTGSDWVLLDSNLNVFEIINIDSTAKTVDILHQAGATVSPVVAGGSPASVSQRYYSDKNEVSFVLGQANTPNGLGFRSQGTILTIVQANIIDGETFVLNDGTNPDVTFEFDTIPNGVGGGNIVVDISGDTTANDVRDTIVIAINGAASLGITASPHVTNTDLVILQNDNLGIIGNQSITNGVTDTNFQVTGMTGGLNAGSLPTPVIPGSGKVANDFGVDTDGNLLDNFEFRTSGYVDDIVNLRKSEIPQFSTNNLELDLRGGVS